MAQMNDNTAKIILKDMKGKVDAKNLSADADSCNCNVCYGTGKVVIPIVGWTWCGCDRKATPHWGDHNH